MYVRTRHGNDTMKLNNITNNGKEIPDCSYRGAFPTSTGTAWGGAGGWLGGCCC